MNRALRPTPRRSVDFVYASHNTQLVRWSLIYRLFVIIRVGDCFLAEIVFRTSADHACTIDRRKTDGLSLPTPFTCGCILVCPCIFMHKPEEILHIVVYLFFCCSFCFLPKPSKRHLSVLSSSSKVATQDSSVTKNVSHTLPTDNGDVAEEYPKAQSLV